MKLTTKGRYAVMAMADLALFKDKGPISLTDISIRQKFFYLFAPPGWSHDGSRKMSTDIKKEFRSN